MLWIVAAGIVVAWWATWPKRGPRRRTGPEVDRLHALVEEYRKQCRAFARERVRVRTLVGPEREEGLADLERIDRERERVGGIIENLRELLARQGFDLSGTELPTMEQAEAEAFAEEARRQVEQELA